MSSDEYRKLEAAARKRAFTIAKITRMDILQDLLDELRKALETGQSLGDFQKGIKSRMKDKGWQGLTPYRVDNIFRTNIQTAYMAGRIKQMRDPDVIDARPYWLYSAVRDGATRPSHLAMDGVVRRYDDPIRLMQQVKWLRRLKCPSNLSLFVKLQAQQAAHGQHGRLQMEHWFRMAQSLGQLLI